MTLFVYSFGFRNKEPFHLMIADCHKYNLKMNYSINTYVACFIEDDTVNSTELKLKYSDYFLLSTLDYEHPQGDDPCIPYHLIFI